MEGTVFHWLAAFISRLGFRQNSCFALLPGFSAAVLLLLLTACVAAPAQEIPLETCDRLPVVRVSISGTKYLFLVDTAATSMLNLKSFPHGDPRRISVTSWSGTVEAGSQEVTLGDLAVGKHHFKSLRLPALDLSALGRACGRQIDGILGIDLLGVLGASVDLKGPAPRLLVEAESLQSQIAELEREMTVCVAAFNRADEGALAECLDPQIIVFAAGGDFYGRDAVLAYYRDRYFRHSPPGQLQIVPRAHHPIGDAMWMEYDLRITLGDQILAARGTALCQRNAGRWRIVHMNHSNPVDGTAQAAQDK
jgi:ketosteroid isomerase-like protein